MLRHDIRALYDIILHYDVSSTLTVSYCDTVLVLHVSLYENNTCGSFTNV